MKKKLQNSAPDTDSVYNNESIVSANDCTGLTPTPPLTEEESESYEDLGEVYQPNTGKNMIAEDKVNRDSSKKPFI